MTTYHDLFTFLDHKLTHGERCDNTLRLTKEFAASRDLSFGELSQILEETGGYCDCEVLSNAAERIPASDVIGHETFQTPTRRAIEQGWYCHSRVNGQPVSLDEAMAAKGSGLTVEWNVPCGAKDPYAMPDRNRAITTPP